MDSADLIRSGEVGDRTGHAHDAVKSPGRQPHRRGGVSEKLPPGLVGRRYAVEKFAVCLRIRARPMAVVAVGLDLSRTRDTLGHFGTALGRRRKGEVGGRDAGHLDVKVDPVE